MVSIMRYRKFYYMFSGLLALASVLALVFWGLNLGIDFKGGSLLLGEFSKQAMSQEEIKEAVKDIGLGEVIIQPTGEKEVTLRFNEADESKRRQLVSALQSAAQNKDKENNFTQKSFESVGPSIGKELRSKAAKAVIIVLIFIIGYVAFAFRKVSRPLASWKYGAATLVALFHDMLLPLGLFSALGHFDKSVEISSGFIAAILTVLGYSVHDSIIVFDRVRENLIKNPGKNFEEIANISVNQTFIRSLNTSLTVILVLLAVYLFGGESIRSIALVLIAGIGVGTYSSIFIGSSLLVSWSKKLRM